MPPTSDAPSVVLLESSPASREIYAEALRADFDVIATSNEDEAFMAASQLGEGIVVVTFDDTSRPHRFAFCERMKGHPQTEAVPVLIGSADLTDADIHRATELAVLAMALPRHEGTKLAAAVGGIVAVQRFPSASAHPPETKHPDDISDP
jgi:DNA-binding NarL/FixJ family response regulator